MKNVFKIIQIITCIIFCIIEGTAQTSVIPRHGAYEATPGLKWEDAFVSGNGRMGAMMFGKPGEETFIATHCRLFLPLGSREIVPDVAQYLSEARKIYRDENPGKAREFLFEKAKMQGFPGLVNTDPFHPGFFVKINQHLKGETRDYYRTENFSTGEVITSYKDESGVYLRKMFVSRSENVILLSLHGPGICELEFPKLENELINSQINISNNWVEYHNIYKKGKGGYDAGIRIVHKRGKVKVIGNKVQIDGAEEVVLQMQIVPWKTPMSSQQSEVWAYSIENSDFKKAGYYNPSPALAEDSQVSFLSEKESASLLPSLKKALMKGSVIYRDMLDSHIAIHQELFDRVLFDLNSGADYRRTVTDLLEEAAKTGKTPSALMEKMYDAGRYMLICSAGELLPNLQGIWTGTWKPEWSGDFTLDANVSAAMASACSSNLTELQEGFFRKLESFYPEWRLNAKRMYGCRGVLTNARASNTALLIHWGPWSGSFWTAGCGWLASFFSRYVDYTQDMDFLKSRCLPLLKEIVMFYEDFLKEDVNGKLEFIPSYNPETGYQLSHQYKISATMDIAVLKEVLTDLIRFSNQLGINGNDIVKWKTMLEKLPDFPVHNGKLTEWVDGGLATNHRHYSLFYPCFQSFDLLFETNMVLRAAAQSALHLKIEGTDSSNDQQSSFG